MHFNVRDSASLPAPRLRYRSVNNRGQTLIGVVVTASIIPIVMMGFMTMFKSQSMATRNIAAHSGITDLTHALDLQFGSPNCASSGAWNSAIVGGTLSTTLVSPPTLALTALPVTGLTPSTIETMIQPYSVGTITTKSQGDGASNTSGFTYPFRVAIPFTNSAKGPVPASLQKYVLVYTDGNNNVVGACYGGAGSTTSTTTSTGSSVIKHFGVITASGNWTVPAGVSRIEVEVWGGGGGGGGAMPVGGYTVGGGGGAYGMDTFDVVPGTVYSVTIGPGGAGGVSSGSSGLPGSNGGTTSFGTLISAGGGIGGQPISNTRGGAGGVSTATFNIPGQEGGGGSFLGETVAGGAGGSSPRGGLGGPATFGYAPAGSAPGGGGGGGTWNTNGGKGGSGRVIVWW